MHKHFFIILGLLVSLSLTSLAQTDLIIVVREPGQVQTLIIKNKKDQALDIPVRFNPQGNLGTNLKMRSPQPFEVKDAFCQFGKSKKKKKEIYICQIKLIDNDYNEVKSLNLKPSADEQEIRYASY